MDQKPISGICRHIPACGNAAICTGTAASLLTVRIQSAGGGNLARLRLLPVNRKVHPQDLAASRPSNETFNAASSTTR